MSSNTTVAAAVPEVDVRAPRFTATLTAAVLVAVLVMSAYSVPGATVLLALQAAAFGAGALWGPQRHPYGMLFRRFVSPRIGPATEREAVAPLRFAQLIGFLLTTAGVLGFALGHPALGFATTGFALVGALARSVFGVCLSRKLYMLISRLRGEVPACCQKK